MCADGIHSLDSLHEANFKMPEKIHHRWLYFFLLLLLLPLLYGSILFLLLLRRFPSIRRLNIVTENKTMLFNMPHKSQVYMIHRTEILPHSLVRVHCISKWYALEWNICAETMWSAKRRIEYLAASATHASAIKASRLWMRKHGLLHWGTKFNFWKRVGSSQYFSGSARPKNSFGRYEIVI